MAAAHRRVPVVRNPALKTGSSICAHGAAFAAALLCFATSALAEPLLWPLDYPPRVSSTFGTYRIGHHHAGLDLTTDGDTAVAVQAIAAGEVVRIRRSDRGFGRAVYVAHPDGTTSVYAHLSGFGPALRDAVRAAEERSGAYAFKSWPRPAIPVSRGEVLGWIGTSGTDLLHLHFEIRKGGQPVNPLTHGLPLPDTRPPIVRRLLAVPRTPSAHVDDALDERMYRFDADGTLPEPVVVGGDVRLMVEAIDFIDGMSRAVSPYSVELFIGDRRWHRSVYERVSYDDKGHTELDYHPRLRAHGEGVFHTLVAGKGPSVRAHRKAGRSLTRLKRGDHPARIVVKDAAGHSAEARFTLRVRRAKTPCAAKRRRVRVRGGSDPARGFLLRDDLLAIPVPELCDADGVYDVRVDGKRQSGARVTRVGNSPALALTVPGDVITRVEVGVSTASGPRWRRVDTLGGPEEEPIESGPVWMTLGKESRFWSYPTAVEGTRPNPGGPGLDPVTPIYRMANGWVPTKSGSTLGLVMPSVVPPRSALYFHERGRWWWMGRTKRGRHMRGWTVHFGEYAIMTDTEPPEVGAPRMEPHVAGPRLVVPVADEGSGIRRVSLLFDGEPVPFERQRGWGRIIYRPTTAPAAGPHLIEVEVEDRVGQTDRRSATVIWPASRSAPPPPTPAVAGSPTPSASPVPSATPAASAPDSAPTGGSTAPAVSAP